MEVLENVFFGSMTERRTLAKLKKTFQGTKVLPTSEEFFQKIEKAQDMEEGKFTCARDKKRRVQFHV